MLLDPGQQRQQQQRHKNKDNGTRDKDNEDSDNGGNNNGDSKTTTTKATNRTKQRAVKTLVFHKKSSKIYSERIYQNDTLSAERWISNIDQISKIPCVTISDLSNILKASPELVGAR